jgi:hypothetical protein
LAFQAIQESSEEDVKQMFNIVTEYGGGYIAMIVFEFGT